MDWASVLYSGVTDGYLTEGLERNPSFRPQTVVRDRSVYISIDGTLIKAMLFRTAQGVRLDVPGKTGLRRFPLQVAVPFVEHLSVLAERVTLPRVDWSLQLPGHCVDSVCDIARLAGLDEPCEESLPTLVESPSGRSRYCRKVRSFTGLRGNRRVSSVDRWTVAIYTAVTESLRAVTRVEVREQIHSRKLGVGLLGPTPETVKFWDLLSASKLGLQYLAEFGTPIAAMKAAPLVRESSLSETARRTLLRAVTMLYKVGYDVLPGQLLPNIGTERAAPAIEDLALIAVGGDVDELSRRWPAIGEAFRHHGSDVVEESERALCESCDENNEDGEADQLSLSLV